jgi:hypothetical protein
LDAVARASSDADEPNSAQDLASGGVPTPLGGPLPPGMVLSEPESPMLAGAVALAAGHFQPLIRLEAPSRPPGSSADAPRRLRYGDTLDPAQAWEFVRQIEARAAALLPRYGDLGDDCDFLTLAGDWPYLYTTKPGNGTTRDIYALDDLIGRAADHSRVERSLQVARRRWAFAGRLLGDPAASVARAMAALFLRPDSALLWNTYGTADPWSAYDMRVAANQLGNGLGHARTVLHRWGGRADIAGWHRALDPVNTFGFVFLNSTGGPQNFTIPGGQGRAGDVPNSVPAAVVMIHSFSAADPANPQTIAGRWLSHGAYVYFGSVHEPFLHAFRTPGLVVDLLAAGIPLVAALRQGESESFGHPWRLVYLGDPLYRIQLAHSAPDSADAMAQAGTRGLTTDPARASPTERSNAIKWWNRVPDRAHWRVLGLTAPPRYGAKRPEPPEFGTDDDRLVWCLDQAIAHLRAEDSPDQPAFHSGAVDEVTPTKAQAIDWRSVLRGIRRDKLDVTHRPFFDELLIDTLNQTGSFQELQARLSRIPAGESSPLVWETIETCAFYQLARLVAGEDATVAYRAALDLWDEAIRLPWPPDQSFPSHFTERISALAEADAPRRLAAWHERLKRAADLLAANRQRATQATVVRAEAARIAAKLGRSGPAL